MHLGIASPHGGARQEFGAGPTGKIEVNSTAVPGSIGISLEWTRLGNERTLESDLRVYGISINGLWKWEREFWAPYVAVGLGGYRLQRMGTEPNSYGNTPALHAALGIQVQLWSRISPLIEVSETWHLTDYASDEFTPTRYGSIRIGARVIIR